LSCFTLSIDRKRHGGMPNMMSIYRSYFFCSYDSRSFITMGLQLLFNYLQLLSFDLYAPSKNYTENGILIPVS
jgi:hypothetical protein